MLRIMWKIAFDRFFVWRLLLVQHQRRQSVQPESQLAELERRKTLLHDAAAAAAGQVTRVRRGVTVA